MEKSKDIIYLRNKAQVIIYDKELRGQISDGMWENEKTDERLWHTQVKVASGKNKVGCSFTPRYPIDFNELDYVRDRAIEYVQEMFPKYNEDKLSKDLEDITKIIFGENPVKIKMVTCPNCGGSGIEEEECTECGGDGQIDDPENDEEQIECPACDGSGYDSVDCYDCSGTGEIEEEV